MYGLMICRYFWVFWFLLLNNGVVVATSQNTLSYQVKGTQNQFEVTLPSNPTTGYQWAIQQYDQRLLTLEGSQFMPPNSKLIGAPGKMSFCFSIKKGIDRPASTLLQFIYRRSWEPKTGTIKEVTINFLPQ